MRFSKNFGAFQLNCWNAQSAVPPLHASTSAGRFFTVESASRDQDAELMLRARNGDDAAFEALVDRYRQPLASLFFRMTYDQSVAEELAQETFLCAYRLRKTCAVDTQFTIWIYRIGVNLAVSRARDIHAKAALGIDKRDEETDLTPDIATPSPTPEQAILRREKVAAVRRYIDALPERERLAVLMHKYQGLDCRQIAGVLELSESATKLLLLRAYKTLGEKLKEFL